jgi:hypothetical protein
MDLTIFYLQGQTNSGFFIIQTKILLARNFSTTEKAQVCFALIFPLHLATKGRRIPVRYTFTVRHPWRHKNKEGGRILKNNYRDVFSLIGLDFSLVTDDQTSGFVEPGLFATSTTIAYTL